MMSAVFTRCNVSSLLQARPLPHLTQPQEMDPGNPCSPRPEDWHPLLRSSYNPNPTSEGHVVKIPRQSSSSDIEEKPCNFPAVLTPLGSLLWITGRWVDEHTELFAELLKLAPWLLHMQNI
ncbi:uncharacterized protein M8220_006193 isoform 2-T8 [Acridotheres tristis]